MERPRVNKTTIRSLTDRDTHMLCVSEQTCMAFQQYFAQLFGESHSLTTVLDFSSYLDDLLLLLAANARLCIRQVTAAEISEAMNECTVGR